MHKKSLYRIMICATFAMMSGALHSMQLITECCKKKELKTEPLEFKTTHDVPLVGKFDYRGLGFIAGCAQQAYSISRMASSKSAPVIPLLVGSLQFPTSLLLAFCLYGYYGDLLKGLREQKDDAIGVVFSQFRPQRFCDEFYAREQRLKKFQETYKEMRAGSIEVDPRVVAAHNVVIERCIKRRLFLEGYGFGVSLGFPASILLLL